MTSAKIPNIDFGIRIPPCAPVTEVAKAVSLAESRGFDVAWIADSQLLWRDVYAAMVLSAVQTSSIRLATAVTNFKTRHPSVVASAINTISEVAPGRVLLGLGTGDSSVKPLNMKPTTLASMRQSIDMVRTLLRGKEYEFGHRTSRLRDAQQLVPIHLAASGPKTFHLAGEIADGALTLAGVSPETIGEARSAIRAGCAESGRRIEDMAFTVGTFCRVTDDIERDAALLKPICFHMASIGGQSFLEIAGIELEAPPYVPAVYPDMVHAEDWDLAVKEASRYVTDEMAIQFSETFCLFGSVEEIVAKIRRTQSLGATGLYLRHVGNYTLPLELIEVMGDEVIPRFKPR